MNKCEITTTRAVFATTISGETVRAIERDNGEVERPPVSSTAYARWLEEWNSLYQDRFEFCRTCGLQISMITKEKRTVCSACGFLLLYKI